MSEPTKDLDVALKPEQNFIQKREKEQFRLESLAGKDKTIISVGESGYIVHDDRSNIVAEAPWVILDLDDTALRYTESKEACQNSLREIGIPQDVIDCCDKLSRIGSKGRLVYQPELEKRLLSHALQELSKVVSLDRIMRGLNDLCSKLTSEGFEGVSVDQKIDEIYAATRYKPDFYPDTRESLKRLRNSLGKPVNIAILTFGDPTFQLKKSVPLLDAGLVDEVWLTDEPKAKFLEQVINQKPHKSFKLQYEYPETQPKGAGIDFEQWQTMVMIFDDNPIEVEEINKRFSNSNVLVEAVCVRRPGVSRKSKPLFEGTQIHLSNTYADTEIVNKELRSLTSRQLENFLLKAVREQGPAIFDQQDFQEVIAGIAYFRDLNPEQVEADLKRQSGYLVTIKSGRVGAEIYHGKE